MTEHEVPPLRATGRGHGAHLRLTTVWGLALIVLAALGLVFEGFSVVAQAMARFSAREAFDPLSLMTVTLVVLALLTKVGLAATGTLMLRRSARAIAAVVTTFVVSLVGEALQTIDLVLYVRRITEESPDQTVTPIEWIPLVVWLSVIVELYVATIVYLRRPATRAEFAGGSPVDDVFE